MAGSVNKVILVGRLGRDPEKRNFSNGGSVVSFGLATSETWKDKGSGERKEKTTWHNVVIFNDKLGEIAEKYLRKGQSVYLEGRIETRTYQDKDGNERSVTEIVLPRFGGELTLLEKADGAAGGDGGNRRAAAPAERSRAPAGGSTGSGTGWDDDIPFGPER